MKRFALYLTAALLACAGASAQEPSSFEGKTITLIVGFPTGGGTDVFARLIAPYLAKNLPGAPHIIVQNRPGADGVTASNYFTEQVKPDGLTIAMGSSQLLNPIIYRTPTSKYDATKFSFIGGSRDGGSTYIINTESAKRLHDKAATPVIVGSLGVAPRSGALAAAWGIEFLGWNARWVPGYRGTPDIILALQRGEVEMASTGTLSLVNDMLASGKFKILMQTGAVEQGRIVPRSDIGDVPTVSKLLEGKIKDPVGQQGFDFWNALVSIDKWVALPPGTPQKLVEVYREAYRNIMKDPEFLERSKKISKDFAPQSANDIEAAVKTLGDTSPNAIEFISTMLSKQGIGTGR